MLNRIIFFRNFYYFNYTSEPNMYASFIENSKSTLNNINVYLHFYSSQNTKNTKNLKQGIKINYDTLDGKIDTSIKFKIYYDFKEEKIIYNDR